MNSNNLKNLNSKQVDAVKSLGPVLVIAGAGTGKTRVLTTKIIDLLNDNVSQDEIYAFTFTNKAAKEMMARVVEKTDKLITCKISTFHSFFFKELNYYGDMLGFQFPI